ncbi:putative ABC transporter permease [Anaerocolumna jejuensis]|nr:putative ABC transporter permease [Anaerocolumna jejuensis]
MCTLILEFFIFSIAGWGWEVLLYGYQHHAFINRGVLHGPWLPIYGSGSMLILILLGGLRKRPVKLFLITMVLCGVIEYVPSVWQYVLCILLSIVFAADIIFSLHRPNAGMGITF